MSAQTPTGGSESSVAGARFSEEYPAEFQASNDGFLRQCGKDAEIMRAAQPRLERKNPPTRDWVFVHFDTHVLDARWNAGDGWHRADLRRGTLIAQPPQQDYCIDVPALRATGLAVSAVRIGELLQYYGVSEQTLWGCVEDGFVDPAGTYLIETLWKYSRDSSSGTDELYIDGLMLQLIGCFLRSVRQETPAMQRIDRPQMTFLLEFIEENLERSIKMSDLRLVSELSEREIISAFKAQFASNPYQYVLSRRIARAQELLATGNMPLAEIAYTCGFASQSHMTDVFRQKLGVTPGRYRKEVQT